MNVLFIMNEDPFFKPVLLEHIIKSRPNDKFAIAVHPKTAKKNSKKKLSKIYNSLYFFGIKGIIILGTKFILFKVFEQLGIKNPFDGRDVYSLKKGVAKKFFLPVFLTKNVNDPEFLERLRREFSPDVIISSSSQIWGKELLNLPNICCINRHSALLPKYRGLEPVFWAMINEENEIGVTIHKMCYKIDGGEIIEQQSIPINNDDTIFSLYQKAFCIAPYLIVKALETLEAGRINFPPIDTKSGSYFSSPSIKDIIRFRKLGKHFI